MMRNKPCRIRLTGAMIAAVLLLSACGASAPVAISTGSSNASRPQIILTPSAGAPNSAVNVDGSGFPVNAHIELKISSSTLPSESQPIGEVVADDNGQFKLIFIIPPTWSDGKPIGDGGLVLSGTTSDSSVTASAQYQVQAETPSAQSTRSSADTGSVSGSTAPKINLTPDSGGPGTRVELTGNDFPVDTAIDVHIGLSDAGVSSQPYATGISDRYGNVVLQFAIRDALPDGTALKRSRLVIEATTKDGGAKARADFNYSPVPSVSQTEPNTAPIVLTSAAITGDLSSTLVSTSTTGTGAQYYAGPINVSIDFLNSLLRDPSGNSSVTYLSDRLRAEITNNWVLPTGLGVQPGYSSFEVVFLSKSDEGVVIKATLTYETGASIRDFTLTKTGDAWRIDKVVSGSR